MTILGIQLSDLELVVVGSSAWFGVCIFLAWRLCRRGGPYDRPDHDKAQKEADELFAPVKARAR